MPRMVVFMMNYLNLIRSVRYRGYFSIGVWENKHKRRFHLVNSTLTGRRGANISVMFFGSVYRSRRRTIGRVLDVGQNELAGSQWRVSLDACAIMPASARCSAEHLLGKSGFSHSGRASARRSMVRVPSCAPQWLQATSIAGGQGNGIESLRTRDRPRCFPRPPNRRWCARLSGCDRTRGR